MTYSAGQILFQQGDDGDAAYVVLSGTADILVDSDSGPDQGCRAAAEFDRRRDRHSVQRLAHRHRQATSRWRPCASARIISCGLCSEFPEMTVEIMRVLADRLSHTTADLIGTHEAPSDAVDCAPNAHRRSCSRQLDVCQLKVRILPRLRAVGWMHAAAKGVAKWPTTISGSGFGACAAACRSPGHEFISLWRQHNLHRDALRPAYAVCSTRAPAYDRPAGRCRATGVTDFDLLFTHCHYDHILGLPFFCADL